MFLLTSPEPITKRQYVRRKSTEQVQTAKVEKYLAAKYEQSGNGLLFDDLFTLLKGPIFAIANFPKQFSSDIRGVDVVEVDDDEIAQSVAVPYEAWNEPWVEDRHALGWSFEGLLFLQVRLFWRSLEELGLNNNELEKWSALRWILRPAIWKHFVWDKKLNKSHCFPVHERDDPFSFHNCCIAARMDEDEIRAGVRRNVSAEIIKAVEKVCTFD